MKTAFANEINLISERTRNLSSSACERYGMTWGCDGGCDVFRNGGCKMEDVEAFRESILNTNRFDSLTFEELNVLYPQLNL